MATPSEKRTALKNWITGVVGYDSQKVIFEYAGGPKPNSDFVMFGPLATVKRLSQPFISDSQIVAGELINTYSVIIEARTAINVYSLDGVDVLERLAISPNIFEHRSTLFEGDLVLASVSNVIPLPTFEDTGPQYRYMAFFIFRTQINLGETDHELQQMNVTGQLIKPDDSVINVQLSLDFT